MARQLQHELARLPMHRDRLAPNLAHKEGRRTRPLSRRQAHFVLRQRTLHRLPDLALGPKKTIRRHQIVDPLVGPKVIIVVDEMLEPLTRLLQIQRAHPLPKFIPNRLPQPLAFAHRLRMVASRHHVPYSLLGQKALEFGLASPGKILPPLIGEYFLRASKTLDTAHEGFHDKVTRLP
jgi:hypothetical protein